MWIHHQANLFNYILENFPPLGDTQEKFVVDGK